MIGLFLTINAYSQQFYHHCDTIAIGTVNETTMRVYKWDYIQTSALVIINTENMSISIFSQVKDVTIFINDYWFSPDETVWHYDCRNPLGDEIVVLLDPINHRINVVFFSGEQIQAISFLIDRYY